MKSILLSFLCFLLFKYASAQQKEFSQLTISVKDGRGNILPCAEVWIFDSKQNQFSVFADSSGVAVIKLARNQNFELWSSALDHYDSKLKPIITDSAIKSVVLVSEEIYIDYVLKTPVLEFDKSSIELTALMISELDSFVSSFNNYRRLLFDVISYTENKGNPEDNLELSIKRATIISNYLEVRMGGRGNCFVAKGYGGFRPFNTCKTTKCKEEDKLLNNKVIIRLVKKIK